MFFIMLSLLSLLVRTAHPCILPDGKPYERGTAKMRMFTELSLLIGSSCFESPMATFIYFRIVNGAGSVCGFVSPL
jgi:hypothetical protein